MKDFKGLTESFLNQFHGGRFLISSDGRHEEKTPLKPHHLINISAAAGFEKDH